MAVRLPFVNVTLSPHRLWNTAAIVNLLSPPLFIITPLSPTEHASLNIVRFLRFVFELKHQLTVSRSGLCNFAVGNTDYRESNDLIICVGKNVEKALVA
jgi:hypothetical protein